MSYVLAGLLNSNVKKTDQIGTENAETLVELSLREKKKVPNCSAAFGLLLVHKGLGSYFHFRVLVRALIDVSRSPPHRHGRPQSVCSPCSFVHLDRAPTACVLSPRDWTVSIGSHVQQDIDMSKAPPQHGAPFPLLQTAHVKNINGQIDAYVSEMTVLGTCCNACLPLRWAQNGFCTE